MSSPLAIGAVSAVLRNLLDNGIIEQVALGTTVNVTATAPDTIKLDTVDDPPQLNIFLYQVTPNAAWRNVGLPSRNGDGDRLTNPPLALDLHYLITAYGRTDFQAEILLGYAMHLLHERPRLDRPAIRRALNPSPLDVSMLPPTFQTLAASDLADQVEAIRITPVAMPVEELSKLWSAIQSHYRPSAAYQVSVVLIDGKKPTRQPLPVLSRGPVDPVTNRDRGVVCQRRHAAAASDPLCGGAACAADGGPPRRDSHGDRRAARRRSASGAPLAPSGDRSYRTAGRCQRRRHRVHVRAARRRRRADDVSSRPVAGQSAGDTTRRSQSARDQRRRAADCG